MRLEQWQEWCILEMKEHAAGWRLPRGILATLALIWEEACFVTRSVSRALGALLAVLLLLAASSTSLAAQSPVEVVVPPDAVLIGARLLPGSPVRFVRTQGGAYYLKGFTAGPRADAVTAAVLICQFDFEDGVSVRVLHDGRELEASSIVGTGDMFVFARDSQDFFNARCVIQGDVLGTGYMSLSQLVRTAAAFRGVDPLRGAFLSAADFTGTGGVTLSDLVGESRLYKLSLAARPAAARAARRA